MERICSNILCLLSSNEEVHHSLDFVDSCAYSTASWTEGNSCESGKSSKKSQCTIFSWTVAKMKSKEWMNHGTKVVIAVACF